jgi:hypothetical protein
VNIEPYIDSSRQELTFVLSRFTTGPILQKL